MGHCKATGKWEITKNVYLSEGVYMDKVIAVGTKKRMENLYDKIVERADDFERFDFDIREEEEWCE
tara:strand:+ start:319 stop:516 length:198 start_codon:yes stop_codon:yes gene_type:complete